MRTGTLLAVVLLGVSTWVHGQEAAAPRSREADSSHGEKQLAKLLSDRPSMRGIFPKDDAVCLWVVRQFNSGLSGGPVRWDDKETHSGRPAENEAAYAGERAKVRVTGSEQFTGRDKWFMLVFELHNIPKADAADDMSRLIRDKGIKRQEFIDHWVEHEFKAIQRVQRFFSRHPIPGATPENAPVYSDYMKAQAEVPSLKDFLARLDALGEGEYDPRDYFGQLYDQLHAYHFPAAEGEE